MSSERPDPAAPMSEHHFTETLSSWWRRISLFTMALGFAVLVLLMFKGYHEAPPIAAQIFTPDSLTSWALSKPSYSVASGSHRLGRNGHHQTINKA